MMTHIAAPFSCFFSFIRSGGGVNGKRTKKRAPDLPRLLDKRLLDSHVLEVFNAARHAQQIALSLSLYRLEGGFGYALWIDRSAWRKRRWWKQYGRIKESDA